MTLLIRRSMHVNHLDETWERASCLVLGLYVAIRLLVSYGTVRMSFPIDTFDAVTGPALISILGLAIAIIVIRRDSFMRWQVVLVIAAFSVFIIAHSRSGNISLAELLVMLMLVSRCRLDRICLAYGTACSVMIVLFVALSIIGLIVNYDCLPNGRLVFGYGASHPNTFGVILFCGIAAMAYYGWNKKCWAIIAVLSLFSSFFAYIVLSSYTSMMVLAFLGIGIIAGHSRVIQIHEIAVRRVLLTLSILLPVALLTLMLLGMVKYSGEGGPWTAWDGLLHGRIKFASYFYEELGGFTIFGRWVTYTPYFHSGLPFLKIDSAYSVFAIVVGLFSMGLYFVLSITAICRLSRDSRFVCVALVYMLCVSHMVMESHGLCLYGCPALVYASAVFRPEKHITTCSNLIEE